ncbi:TetR/AcrR family transcriptional regulator [Microbacterium sp. bgisy189]|uniref:TetR/AcrR family transcriptional regulator n=1 Tax=Microbacterium sp. bgisy189 TaxID=3413798 RepID=UPI003EBFE362
MAKNDDRRTALADAGLRVLATEGARGLTHRAVDAAADVPKGTASNYFASRDALIDALVTRIGERLTPDPAVHAALAERSPDRALFADYTRDIVRRLLAAPDVTLALIELRLEAARRPAVAERLGAWFRAGFAADVAFNAAAGLPGGADEIALLHYAIDGLVLDALTVRIDPDRDIEAAADALVERLLPR